MALTAIDTNVVVRFLTRDNDVQFHRAVDLINRQSIYIPDTVWLESEWVLRYAYGFEPAAVISAFRALLGLPQISVTNMIQMRLAIEWHAAGLDFADAMHLAASKDIKSLATFDKAFSRKAIDLCACRVVDLAGAGYAQ